MAKPMINGEITIGGTTCTLSDLVYALNSAIIEWDTNTNGTYIKFNNGILICYKNISQSVAMTSSWGSMYEGTFSAGNWAMAFAETPTVSVTNKGGAGAMIEGFGTGATTTSCGAIWLCRPTSITNTVSLSIVGIGKWTLTPPVPTPLNPPTDEHIQELINIMEQLPTSAELEELMNELSSMISNGSNGNGSWVRIGKVQICWQNVSTSKTGNSSTWGSSWWGSGSWTYPQAFYSAPVVTATALDNQSGLFAAALNSAPSTTSVTIESFASASYSTCSVACMAIGVWKA